MLKITGAAKLARELDEAQKALGGLDGKLGEVSFDPDDPESIEAAIQSMEQAIDERVARHGRNSIIAPLVEQMKATYRKGILDKASQARLGNEDD